ncbi:MAG: radical SAM family heme chaperone HemW [Clostridia bacterium]|nr:radical SAM family heme chaperone HemW [Clostridia bacterium]
MNTLGLYLHIPFCRSKCLYCDFCSFPRPDEGTVEAYVEALCRDLKRRAAACEDYAVDTVYFGGGTPTLLSAAQLERLMEAVTGAYRLADGAEITAECNPATGSRELFTRMRLAGFNRLSIGLQSAHGEELRALGRLHRFDDLRQTVEDARVAGIDNLSADVMFGIPGQTVGSYLATLEAVCGLGVRHLSAYGLTVEEGTPFGNMGDRLVLPDEEETRRMYFEGLAYLESHGWKQYEISNFAVPGYESRHNLKYWNCDPYLGFGPAAYSDFCGKRFGNSRDVAAYIEGKDITEACDEPSDVERMNEYVMLRMRLGEGISARAFEARFGGDFQALFGKRLEAYLPGGLVRRRGDGYGFSPRGMYVSNSILSEILDFSS